MILVTGATGLLGSHLLVELSHSTVPVRALFRTIDRIEFVKKIFQYYLADRWESAFNKIEWVKGNILDIPLLEENMEGIETVYHCAALVSFSKREFESLIKINREGTANVVNVSLLKGVKTLCYVSSTASIGGQSHTIVSEETKWKQSPKTSGYAISKYSAEKEVWRGVEEGLDCVIVNPSVIFGAGHWDESSLTIFRTVDKGIRFYTNGQGGIVDARDVAEIMVKLTNSTIRNERFLCVGHSVPFKELLTDIAIELGKNPPTINTPKWLIKVTLFLSWFSAKMRGKDAAITRESANTVYSVMEYDSTKVKERLNFSFRSKKETISNTVRGRII